MKGRPRLNINGVLRTVDEREAQHPHCVGHHRPGVVEEDKP